MRADRLLALLLFLQSRGKVTAAQVAEELGISIATARRDLEALSSAGIPVYVQPGRGGGWQLVGGARTNLTGLSGHEGRALFWMLGTAGLSGPGTRVATRKLIHALPESLRDEAETLATAIHYDHAPWGRSSNADAEVDHLDQLRNAIIDHQDITVTYTGRDGNTAAATVHPLGLVAKAGTWYLVARDDQVRTFRVDRISSADPTTSTSSTVDDDFDLAAYWLTHVEEVESLRSNVAATIRCPNRIAPIVASQFGRYFTRISSDDTDTLAEVRANLVVALAEQLAGWGNRIDVLGPPEVQRELARIGAELAARYAEE